MEMDSNNTKWENEKCKVVVALPASCKATHVVDMLFVNTESGGVRSRARWALPKDMCHRHYGLKILNNTCGQHAMHCQGVKFKTSNGAATTPNGKMNNAKLLFHYPRYAKQPMLWT
jgi:hypothetical protein